MNRHRVHRAIAVVALTLAVSAGCGDDSSEPVAAVEPQQEVAVSTDAPLGDGPIDGADGLALAGTDDAPPGLGPGEPEAAEDLRAAAQRFYDALAAADADTIREFFPDGRCDFMRDLMADTVADGYMQGTGWTVREVTVDGNLGYITDMRLSGSPGADDGKVEDEYVYSFELIDGRWMWDCSQQE